MSKKGFLVCNSTLCKSKSSEMILSEMKRLVKDEKYKDIEVSHTICMSLCDDGPNVAEYPSNKYYGHMSIDRVSDIIEGNADDLLHKEEYVNTDKIINEFIKDKSYLDVLRIFREYLSKLENYNDKEVRKMIKEIRTKYNIHGKKLTYPIRIVFYGTIKGPDLPRAIAYYGKERSLELIDNYLLNN